MATGQASNGLDKYKIAVALRDGSTVLLRPSLPDGFGHCPGLNSLSTVYTECRSGHKL